MKTRTSFIKKAVRGVAALILVGILAAGVLSCAVWTTGVEGSTIRMNFSPSGRGLGVRATEGRVWVYSKNIIVPNPATVEGYYIAAISANTMTVTIEELAPGDDYRIVAIAVRPEGAAFIPTAFGTSELFSIKAGTETQVSLDIKEVTIAAGLPGMNLKSTVVSGGTIYAASSNQIFEGLSVGALIPQGVPGAWGTINSLNLTADVPPLVTPELLVNTTAGIRDEDGIPIGTWVGTPPNVLQSGGIAELGTFFYQAEMEFGGWLGLGNWHRVPLDIPVAGRPVLDLLVYRNPAGTIFGYFATRIVGAFRIGSDRITTVRIEDILSGDPASPIIFFGEDLPMIQAFGYVGGATLYLGTRSGVYKTNVDNPRGTIPTLLAGTRGLDVTKIVVHGNDLAFLSAREVVVLKDEARIYRLPFLTSVVGTLTDVAWRGTELIVTGTSGICSVQTLGW